MQTMRRGQTNGIGFSTTSFWQFVQRTTNCSAGLGNLGRFLYSLCCLFVPCAFLVIIFIYSEWVNLTGQPTEAEE